MISIMFTFYQIVLVFGIFQFQVHTLPTDTLTDCNNVKPIFEMRNISSRIPDKPVNGNSLLVCHADFSCCTSEIETNLMTLVKKEYHSLLQHNAQSVQGILASTAIHFQDYVHQMMIKVENKTLRLFHDVFTTDATYTDEPIKTFFADLNNHLNNNTNIEKVPKIQDLKNGDNKLAHITSSFFVQIFPYIFQATLNQYNRRLLPEYKECLQNRMADIFPFTKHIKMLEKDISKTFEATKMLIMSLNFGSQVLNSNLLILTESSFNAPRCYDALLKMTYCGYCNGYPGNVKPCVGYCLNVMRGCLAQQAAEVDTYWNGFYEAMDKLISMVNRGQSFVCLEDLLRSLHSRIAEPMLSFMEQSEAVQNKVKNICGQVKWMNETSHENIKDHTETLGVVPGITLTKLPGSHSDWSMDEDDLNFRSTLLTKKISQFKESVPQSKAFYSNLADLFCVDDSFAETRETVPCWNGARIAEYTKSVVPIQISSQKYNPELPLTDEIVTDPRITDLVEKLRQMKQLILSHISTSPESDSLYQLSNEEGSGSGGSPVAPDEWTDDEDAERGWPEQGSGSGEAATDISDTEAVDKNKEAVDKVHNTLHNKEDDQTTIKPSGSESRFKENALVIAVCLLTCSIFV